VHAQQAAASAAPPHLASHGSAGLSYGGCMKLDQCNAIVLHGRDAKGNRAGLIPPRRCQRVAKAGPYCGLHARNPELHDLIRDCLGPTWEIKVRMWEERRRRDQVREAEAKVDRLSELAGEHVSSRLAWFFRTNRRKVAEALVGE